MTDARECRPPPGAPDGTLCMLHQPEAIPVVKGEVEK